MSQSMPSTPLWPTALIYLFPVDSSFIASTGLTIFRVTRTHEMVVKHHSRNLGIFLIVCLQALPPVQRLVSRTSDTVGTPVPKRQVCSFVLFSLKLRRPLGRSTHFRRSSFFSNLRTFFSIGPTLFKLFYRTFNSCPLPQRRASFYFTPRRTPKPFTVKGVDS